MDQIVNYRAILFPSDGTLFRPATAVALMENYQGRPPSLVSLMTRLERCHVQDSCD